MASVRTTLERLSGHKDFKITQAETKVSFFYLNPVLQVEFRAIFEPFSCILLNDSKRIPLLSLCKSQTTFGSPVVFLQSFVRSAQLSACHLLWFVYEISAQFCHNFTTILPLNHFVHHEISQLFVTILVQNTFVQIKVKSRQIQRRLSRPIGLFI